MLNNAAQLLEQGGMGGAVVGEFVVGVGSGNNVTDTVLLRHAAHAHGNLPGLGAVVHVRQQVTVDVNHRVD